MRGGSRSRKITIDDDDYDEDDEQLDDEAPEAEQDGETAAMAAARQSSAIAQKAMEDALAASAVRISPAGDTFASLLFLLESASLWPCVRVRFRCRRRLLRQTPQMSPLPLLWT